MRVAISLGIGSIAFFTMALALVIIQESIKNPMILVPAVILGLAAAGGAYVLDLLTTPRE